jgi:histidyl-tRNA synthetase
MKAQFTRADKIGARRVIALGDAELADGTATVRDMGSRTEVKVPIAELAAELARPAAT